MSFITRARWNTPKCLFAVALLLAVVAAAPPVTPRQPTLTSTPTPTAAPAPSILANISTRLRVETGDNVLIGGFIVTGTQPKRVIVRAIGPSLQLADRLADPILELRDSSGALIRSNDNWRSDQEAEIIATTLSPTNDVESAIVETLPANGAGYTAILRGVNNGTGIALVEVYDLDLCGLETYAAFSNEQQSALQLPSTRYHLQLDVSNVTYTLPVLDQKIIETRATNQVGVNRPVDLSSQNTATRFTNSDGTQLLVFAIRSPGATRLRAHFDTFELPPGDAVYLRTPSDNSIFAGPYRDKGPWGDGNFWSSSIEGDTLIIEFHIRSRHGSFRIPEISHIYADLERTGIDLVPDVFSCELDASCYADSNKDAVGRIFLIRGSAAYACTGTLLNDMAGDHIPYFLTANHCVSTQGVAQTVETYWFYQTTACNSGVLRSDIGHSPNGANLLVAAAAKDFALLRLVDTPPAGVAFAGWTSSTIPINTTVYGLHHPGPYLPPQLDSYLRRAQGPISNTNVPCGDTGLVSGYQVDWTAGLVEFGSSGSGLWYDGGLIGVSSCINSNLSCSNRHALYSKFSDFYSLVEPYLNAPPQSYTIVTSPSPADGGTAIGSGTFSAGSVRTVTAIANCGYMFVNWTENSSVVSTSASYTFTLNNNRDLVAHFEVSPNPTPTPSKLANISTRGLVQTGNDVLIAGTIVLGQSSQRVIVRAIGPSLNLSGKLADPALELRDGNGVLIRSNDNWRSDQEAEIIATTIPPTNDLEAAIVETLPANGASYTAIVRGAGGTTGIAIVEVYALNH